MQQIQEIQETVVALEERATEAERRATIAEAELAKRDRRDRATALISEAAKAAAVEFSPLAVRGILDDLPLTPAGALDESAFGARLSEAVTTYALDQGNSGVTGFGGGW